MIGRDAGLLVLRSAILVGIIAVSVHALTPLVSGDNWAGEAIVAVAVIAVPVLLTRLVYVHPRMRARRLESALSPILVGLITGVVFVLLRYGTPGTVPTPRGGDESFLSGLLSILDPIIARGSSVAETIAPLMDQIATSTIPMASSPALVTAVGVGIILLYLISEPLVVGLRIGWFALVPIGALWAAPLVFMTDVEVSIIAAGMFGVICLLLLASDSPLFAAKRSAVMVVVASLLVMTGTSAAVLAIGDRKPRALNGGVTLVVPPASFSLTQSVDVGESLSARSQVLAYTYHDSLMAVERDVLPAVVEARNAPMRMTTATDFDGQTWYLSRGQGNRRPVAGETINAPPDGSSAALTHAFTRRVKLASLTPQVLPATMAPSLVREVDATFDHLNSELFSDGDSVTEYVLEAYVEDYSAEELRADSVAMLAVGLDTVYLGLPDLPNIARVEAMARDVVADASTPYDQLVALQAFFRDRSEFTYDTELEPVADGDPVWTFLESRRGYCVQFATSMVLMARSLGIPARFAQGFLASSRSVRGETQITGDRAHAWPEFYFPRYGWVRFEPTPASQTSAAPSWTVEEDNTTTPRPQTPKPPSPKPTSPTPTATPTTPSTTTQNPGGRRTTGARAYLIAGIVAGVSAAGVVIALVIRRRRRGVSSVESVWQRVERAAQRADIEMSNATTPRQVGDAIMAAARARARAGSGDGADAGAATRDRPDLDDLRAAVDVVVDIVEVSRYDDPATQTPAGLKESESAIKDAADAVIAALEELRRLR